MDIITGELQVIIEAVDLTAIIGESAQIDVGTAINYIKSGQAEIGEAVAAGKADITAHTNTKIGEFNDNYIEKKALIDAEVGKAEIWAEGSDAEVESLGGVHSAKGWAEFSKDSPFMLYQPRLSTTTDFGTFVLLKFPFGKTMLVDAGYTGQETAIDNFLASINVSHIDVFMITHFHADHSGCAVHIIDNYCDDKTLFYKCMDVDYSQFTTDESGCATREAAYKAALAAKGYTYTIPGDGKSISLYDERLNLTFYNTDTSNLPTYYNSTMPENTDGHSNANNTSMCCLVEACGTSVFITGDIEFDGQVAVTPKVPTCDVLQVPHHAVNQNGYYKFFDTLNPKIAFFNYNTGLPVADRKYWFKYLFQTGRKCATISNNTANGIILECYSGNAKRFSGEMFDWSFVSWARTYYITDNFPYYNDTTHNARLVANWTIADLVDMTKYSPKSIKIRVNTSHDCTQLISELQTVTSGEYSSWIIFPDVEKIRIESASHATNKVVYAESVSSYYNDYSISKMMSNCVIKGKRRIVLELNSGTLTLKKGSQIYVPNGVGVYDDVATTSDLTLTASTSTDGQYLVAPSASGLSMQARSVEQCTYGAGATAISAFAYDTTTNMINNYSSGGVKGGQYGLPIALITVSNGEISSIDCIFNEFGFIGNDMFSLPMISGFISNGRDSNGYMTEIYFSTSEIMHCSESNAGERYIMLNGSSLDNYEEANYDLDTNIVWNSSNPKISMCICGKITRGTGGAITSFKPKFGFKATDYNDLLEVSEKVDNNAGDISSLQSGKADKATTLSGYGITNAYTKTEVDTIASSKANVGLDNLNATGQMVIDSDNGTKSQCILEIPQNIKLTLFNNVLTLKSGSVLVNTGSTYSTTTISGNKTYTISNSLADGRYVMFANASGFGAPRLISNVYSGTSSEYPTSDLDNNSVFYNTTDKLIYRYNTDSSTWTQYNVCYPVCLIDMVSGVASIAQNSRGQQLIFNSAGYIGHHIFNFPNQIKYLGGNGKDSQGRLLSYENTLGTFNITEMSTQSATDDWFRACVIRANNNTQSGTAYCRVCKTQSELLPQSARLQYVEDDNICYVYSSSGYNLQSRVFFCRYEYDGTTVSDFILPEPVRTATVDMLDKIQDQIGDIDTALTTIIGA